MNSMEFNKIAGAVLGAVLVFLLLNFFSGLIYGTREVGHHEEVLAYALEIAPEEGVAEAAEEETVDLAALVQQASVEEGESVFRACQACHKLEEGANAVGPYLYDVVGRDIASVDGFSYSDVLAAKQGEWTLTALSGFLENPKEWAPGTRMSYAGLEDPEDRVNLIAYLNQVGGTPIDLAEGLEPAAAAAGEEMVGEEMVSDQMVGEVPAGEEAVEVTDGSIATIEGDVRPGTETTGVEVVDTEEDDVAIETTPLEVVEDTDAPVEEQLTEDLEADSPPAAVTEEPEEQEIEVSPVQGVVTEETAEDEPLVPEEALGEGDDPLENEPRPEGVDADEAAVDQEDANVVAPDEAADAEAAEIDTADAATEDAADAGAADEELQVAAADPSGFLAGGDAEAGEKIFRRCRACHVVDQEQNRVGPHLVGVVGRDIAAVEDYNYSDALAGKEGVWNPENLFAYLENPKEWAPGNKMAFAGLKDEQDRIDLITYLNEAGGAQ